MRHREVIRNTRAEASGFSLIELLVVMAIIGLLAAIGIPALKGLSGSNDIGSAARQLLDDLSYARLRAINDRTTVYVVFVSPDILTQPWNNAQRAQIAKVANLQYTGYALFATRRLGDQPGPGNAHYLTEWRSVPDGTFIPTNKFNLSQASDLVRSQQPMSTRPFFYDERKFPFPTEKDTPISLPYIAFDYQGRLTRMEDVMVPISKGAVLYPQDSRDKIKQASLEPAEVVETPKNNYTNNPVIRIDWITGRARVIRPEKVNYAAKL